MSLGEELRRARLAAGVSQRSLARRAGTSQAAISRIERGLEQPTFARFEQLLTGLGLRPAIALEPIAAHEAEPRRLLAQAQKSHADRLREGLAWARFVRRLEAASAQLPR